MNKHLTKFSVCNEILTNQDLGNLKQFTSEIKYTNDWFRQGDYISVSRIRFTDMFNAQGSIVVKTGNSIFYSDPLQINTTDSDYFMYYINSLQFGGKSFSTYFTIEYNKPYFSLTSKTAGNSIVVSGTIQQMFGIYGQLDFPDLNKYQLGKTIFGIKYLKLSSPDIEAAKDSTCYNFGQQYLNIDTQTIAVIPANQITQGFSENSTFGIHMPIKNNMPIRFILLDQDNQRVHCSQFLIDGQIYRKQFFREGLEDDR